MNTAAELRAQANAKGIAAPATEPSLPAPPTASAANDYAARLAAAKEARAKREAERDREQQAAQLEELELEDRFEREIGRRGRDFQIVDCTAEGGGFVVLKLGDTVAHKRFKNSKMSEVDAQDYVLPSLVHPSKERFLALLATHGEVAHNCALELAKLHGLKLKDDAGKS